MPNAYLYLARLLYPKDSIVRQQAHEIARLEREVARLRAERDDAEAFIERRAQAAISEAST